MTAEKIALRRCRPTARVLSRGGAVGSIVVAFASLVACGEGASTGSEAPSGTPEVAASVLSGLDDVRLDRHGPFADLAQRASDDYVGSTAASSLDADAAGVFLQTLLVAPLARKAAERSAPDERSYALASRATDGAVGKLVDFLIPQARGTGHHDQLPWQLFVPDIVPRCLGGGELRVEAPVTNQRVEATLHFERCREAAFVDPEGAATVVVTAPEVVLDGAVRVFSSTGLNRGTFLGFDELRVSGPDRDTVLIGAESWSDMDCSRAPQRDIVMLYRDVGSGESVLLENLRASRIGMEEPEEHCRNFASREANRFEGRLLHSVHGAVNVVTNDYLPFVRALPGRREATPSGLDHVDEEMLHAGDLLVFGADGRVLRVALRGEALEAGTGLERERYGVDERIIVDATLSQTTASQTTAPVAEASVSEDDMVRGALSTLADADADGLPDGWERLHGLDPASAFDGESDADADGLSALEEYRVRGDPREADTPPVRLDEGVRARTVDSALSPRVPRRIDFTVALDSVLATDRVEVRTGEILLRLEGNAAFAEPNGSLARDSFESGGVHYLCVPTDAERRTARCTVRAEPRSIARTVDKAFDTVLVDVELYGGDAELVVELLTSRIDANPDNDRARLRLETPPVDLFVETDDETARGSAHEVRSLTATVGVRDGTLSNVAEVEIVADAGIVVEGARQTIRSLSSSDADVTDCTIGTIVRCPSFETVGVRYPIELEVDYRIVDADVAELRWTVASEGREELVQNNTATTRVERFESSSILQALIDAAKPGDRVEFPSGLYLGSIDGLDKRLHVRGATTEPTVLLSDDTDTPLLSGIGEGSLYEHLVFRSRGTAIDLSGRGAAIADSVFEPDPGPRGTGQLLKFAPGARLRFVNNTVRGFVSCRYLFHLRGHEEVLLEHNLFVDNVCRGLFRGKGDAGGGLLWVIRNTFVRNPHLIEAELVNHTLRFDDNIVTGTRRMINGSLNAATYEVSPYERIFALGRLVTSRNLLFGNEEPTLIPESLIASARFVRLNADLGFDPLFIGADDGDFRLSAASGAIDQSEAVRDTTTLDRIRGVTAFTVENEPVAFDGLGDGTARFDLGAFEYRP